MIKTNIELVNKVKEIATKYKTLYVMGCFGAPLKKEYKERYCNNYAYNKQASRTAMIKAASEDTFGFDCVCLIKGVLWGWNGDKNAVYGGAKYASNGVPDIDCDIMFNKCSGISSDFSKIEVGEAVWLKGHIGVYIGDGLAVECTPAFDNKVQITAVKNIGEKEGYNSRKWTKHGKLPYITYTTTTPSTPTSSAPIEASENYSVGDVVNFTGNIHYASSTAVTGSSCKPGKAKITNISKGAKHPYHVVKENGGTSTVYGWVDANDVQKKSVSTNTANTASQTNKKSISEIAAEVVVGLWGNGEERKKRLTQAGYDVDRVQREVNVLLNK